MFLRLNYITVIKHTCIWHWQVMQILSKKYVVFCSSIHCAHLAWYIFYTLVRCILEIFKPHCSECLLRKLLEIVMMTFVKLVLVLFYSRTVRHTHNKKDTTNICSHITTDLIIHRCTLTKCNFSKHGCWAPWRWCDCTETCRSYFNVNFNIVF